MSTPTPDLRTVLDPAIHAVGLVCDQVDVHRTGGRTTVVVVVDVGDDDDGSLDLDRIERVSHAIGEVLDDAGVFPDGYVLEVASPGVGRPLKRPVQFQRNLGRRLNVVTSDTAIIGRLVAVEDSGIVLVGYGPAVKGRRPRELPPASVTWAEITSAHVEVDLNGLDDKED